MPAHAYTEDQLVEQPAIGLFAELGWQTVSARDETFGTGGTSLASSVATSVTTSLATSVSTLGRETKGEVVLVDRLRAALTKLNANLPAEAIQTAIDELARDRSAMSLEAANREVYRLLKDGIAVSIPNVAGDAREHGRQPGGQSTERLRVVDWQHPQNNDFLLVSQFSVVGSLYPCRPSTLDGPPSHTLDD